MILKLIRETGDEGLEEFLLKWLSGKSLINADNFLLKDLIHAIDDQTLFKGHDNYQRLIYTLTELSVKCNKQQVDFSTATGNDINSRKMHFYDQSVWSKVRKRQTR